MEYQDSDYIEALEQQRGGFDFSNYRRNKALFETDEPSERFSFGPLRKTGTTICGVVCRDAVILATDTRATEDTIVTDKRCCKLHRLADNIYCAGAGISADLQYTTLWLETVLELHRLNSHTQPRVAHALAVVSQNLFSYMGYKVCALVLGGVDATGFHLYSVHPHGSTACLPFTAMGSGSLSAIAVLERGFRDNMNIEEAKDLVIDAISAGIENDLGSGGDIDLCIITKEETKVIRGVRSYLQDPIVSIHSTVPSSSERQSVFPIGTTQILFQKVELIKETNNNTMVDA